MIMSEIRKMKKVKTMNKKVLYVISGVEVEIRSNRHKPLLHRLCYFRMSPE